MTQLQRWKAFSDVLATWVGIIAVISGGIFAAYEYLENEKASRVRETLAFVERFSRSPIYEVRRRLDEAWYPNLAKLETALKTRTSDEQYTQFILDFIERKKLDADVREMIEFFRALAICTKNQICDERTAKSFFGDHAMSFYHLHYRYITYLRNKTGDISYGSEIQQFIKNQN